MDFKALSNLVVRQHGLVTSRQLAMIYTPREQRTLITKGLLQPFRRGVYTVSSAPDSWEKELESVAMTMPSSAAFSHWTAAALWGFLEPEEGVHLVSLNRLTMLGVGKHRTNVLDEVSDVTWRDGRRLTTVERTLFDLAAFSNVGNTVCYIEEALRLGLTSLQRLGDTLERLSACGRNGTANFTQALEQLDDGDGTYKTKLERRVLGWLRAAGLPEPSPQFTVIAAGRRYRLDFAFPDRMVAIEADGFRWHRTRETLDRDAERQLHLTRLGWHVVRVTWHSEKGVFLDAVRSALLRNSA